MTLRALGPGAAPLAPVRALPTLSPRADLHAHVALGWRRGAEAAEGPEDCARHQRSEQPRRDRDGSDGHSDEEEGQQGDGEGAGDHAAAFAAAIGVIEDMPDEDAKHSV